MLVYSRNKLEDFLLAFHSLGFEHGNSSIYYNMFKTIYSSNMGLYILCECLILNLILSLNLFLTLVTYIKEISERS